MSSSDRFETVIGLEIHVQLQTATKLFCACANAFGGEPNTRTCPVCLGMPGALPVLNETAVEYAMRAAQAIGCEINPRSRFARKNYFYPDLPKGYQISQFDQPLAGEGTFAFEIADGPMGRPTESAAGAGGAAETAAANGNDPGQPAAEPTPDPAAIPASVRLTRVHLEEDAGKSIHDGMPRSDNSSYVDLNRCGVPLIEIVTEPDIRSPEEAFAFLTHLRRTLLYVGVTDANMDEGSLRCDANISLREPGATELNPKTELKNLNSFRFVRQALRYEIERHAALLDAGEIPEHGTRLFDEHRGVTEPMREKEEAHDYRYFPEPDLVPIVLDQERIAASAAAIPELPAARRTRFVDEYGISTEDAAVLVEERARAEYFEALIDAGAAIGEANNWVRNEVRRWLNDHGAEMAAFPVEPAGLAALIGAVRDGKVPARVAGEVLDRMAETGDAAADIIAREGLEQVSSSDELAPLIDEVLEAHPDEVAAFRGGREQVFGFLMGQAMRATQGKGNPDVIRTLLRQRLGE